MCVTASATLATYANAIELAFEANLLATAWAGLHRSISGYRKSLSDSAEELAHNNFISEELSIKRLESTIRKWSCATNIFWTIGLAIGLLSLFILYILVWHVPAETPIYKYIPFLMVAAYASPISMLLMASTGWLGNRIARGQHNALADLADKRRRKKEEELLKARKARDAIALTPNRDRPAFPS